MTELLNELLTLKRELEIRISLLDDRTATFFAKDRDRIQRLIDRLTPETVVDGF